MIPYIIKKQSSKLNRARKDNDTSMSLCDGDKKGNRRVILWKCTSCNKFCIEKFLNLAVTPLLLGFMVSVMPVFLPSFCIILVSS
jgi:hypothetical protein